ncbi:Hypothetical predicted protein [Octopus vulgaris]|uniref:Uncharacterized protein n=1 Tax=Octopus vulgaris TaxID=6645 RepID=A0AA36BWX9_OCTVU|nr:Hypothetical predicted protein [Octopus vulgaris]
MADPKYANLPGIVSIQCGVATMYVSFNNSNPSLANYDYITYATDMSPGRMFVGKPTSPSTFFHTISSKMLCGLNTTDCCNAHYNITFTTIGLNDSCTTVQYIFSYTGQPGKYIQYDTAGNLNAICCPENHIFDAILKRSCGEGTELQGSKGLEGSKALKAQKR